MINLNALLRRPVEYYEYPWALESALRSAQAMVRSLFQPPDITYVFSESMPRSGHRFLSECLTHYFGPKLHYCGFYRPGLLPPDSLRQAHNSNASNRYFLQKSHDLGFRDATDLNGRFLIQFRAPIPRLGGVCHLRREGDRLLHQFLPEMGGDPALQHARHRL
jgi:hypothetical protein